MNPKKEYLRLVIALIVLLSILGGFLLYQSLPYLETSSIILSTRPIDPFDPIRGQYMIIGYDIGTIPEADADENLVGKTVYVILEENENGTHQYSDISTSKPSKGTFIKGTAKSYGRVEYGIEQYFFERNARFESRISNVRIKLTGSGRPAIVELLDENLEEIEIIYKDN